MGKARKKVKEREIFVTRKFYAKLKEHQLNHSHVGRTTSTRHLSYRHFLASHNMIIGHVL